MLCIYGMYVRMYVMYACSLCVYVCDVMYARDVMYVGYAYVTRLR